MDNNEIALSRIKIFLNIFLIFLFIYVGADIYLNGDHYEKYIFYNRYIVVITFFLTCLFGLATIIPLVSSLISPKKGLIITSEGLIYNLGAVNFGLIKWSDINKIEVKDIMSKKIIIIHVFNSEFYLKRVKNPFYLFFLKKRLNNYQYLITFSSQLLSINTEELLKILQRSFKKYSKNEGN